MIHKLQALEQSGRRIRVGVIGAGAMGRGVAARVSRAPGMELVFIGDISEAALRSGEQAVNLRGIRVENPTRPPARAAGEVYLVEDSLGFLTADNGVEIDAIVECTNTIAAAGRYCLAAIARKAHVILMNAEVDLALGPLLAHEAERAGVVVTSDAGDQHGVLATMIDEIRLFGFTIVQAGNMKGFLNRYGVAETARVWAEKQRLSVVQTVSYTDGTKMNIEQALIGNYAGLVPVKPGMEGPGVKDVREVLNIFDFDSYGGQGRVDYTVGVPWPGGGVYVVAACDDPLEQFYLNYYKVSANGRYHLFFRPYHLCHLETPRAIAQAYFDKRPVIRPSKHYLNDVYAWAKQDLAPGTAIEHGIGGDELYGMVDATANARGKGVPVCWLESEGHGPNAKKAVIKAAYKKDEPIRLEDVEFPDTDLHAMLKRQAELGLG